MPNHRAKTGCTTEQHPCLQALADALQSNPPADPDAAIRQDLTHHEVVTIDDASTRDIDDGLAVEVMPDGRHKLWVHIADPTRWLAQGDPLDVEARRRAKTLYLPTGLTRYRCLMPRAVPNFARGASLGGIGGLGEGE